jgi:uncharacterized membrane protein YphA (DoxX/SURF4 family)
LKHAEHNVGLLGSGVLLALRLGLGGLFVVAAYQKLFASPFSSQTFSESIRAFQMVESLELVRYATFMIPWVELLAGIALILGIWTRAAGMVISLLLAVFIAGIVSVTARELAVDCSCFGKFKLLCGNQFAFAEGTALARWLATPVGWCKVWEDAAMLVASAALWAHGGGRLALDRVLARGAGRKA